MDSCSRKSTLITSSAALCNSCTAIEKAVACVSGTSASFKGIKRNGYHVGKLFYLNSLYNA